MLPNQEATPPHYSPLVPDSQGPLPREDEHVPITVTNIETEQTDDGKINVNVGSNNTQNVKTMKAA